MALMVFRNAFLLILACSSNVRAQEPVGQECPRFSYEYKLMEKLLKLEIEVDSLKERLRQLDQHISKTTETVAVHVGLIKDLSVLNGEPVKFDKVLTDSGRSYNTSEGVFVAPVSGVYILSASLCVDNKLWVTGMILHNGVQVGYFFTGDTEWESCGTFLTTRILDAGDRVWVVKSSGNTNTLHEYYGWNTFSANLVART